MGEKLSIYLNSDEFIKAISCFDYENDNTFNIIGMIINYTIMYNIIFPDSNNINEMINDLAQFLNNKEQNINNFISNQIIVEFCKTFNINRNEAEINKVRILEYIYNKITIEGYSFHGFNSAFLEDIKKEGLSINNREWDNDELIKLNKIFENKGIKNVLGFIFHNCQDAIYFSKRPIFTYHYASSSPEWFSIFCGETTLKTSNERLAYKKRDYEKALENINNLIENENFSTKEKQYILLIFKKYWLKFNKGEPTIALVKHIFKFGQPMYDGEYNNLTLNAGISRILQSSQLLNIKYEDNISPERIDYINLPRYDKIITRVRTINEEKKKISI